MIVALFHEDEDAAEANADDFEAVVDDGVSSITDQPWSDVVSVDGTEDEGSS